MEWQNITIVIAGLGTVITLSVLGFGEALAFPVLTWIGGLITPLPLRRPKTDA